MKIENIILVADDHPVNRKVMGLLLDSLDLKAEFVCDGFEVLKAAESSTYSLILMDLMMPKMDGFQASFGIRKNEFNNTRRTPIIACTAMDIDKIVDRCIHSGIDDYLGKPFNVELLKQKIGYWLNPNTNLQALTNVEASLVKIQQQNESIKQNDSNMLFGLRQLDDVMQLFLTVTETLLDQLETAIAQQDDVVVRHMAHEIKGSSFAVSAQEMAVLCLEMENAGESKNWSEVQKLYAALGLAFARVRQFSNDRKTLRAS